MNLVFETPKLSKLPVTYGLGVDMGILRTPSSIPGSYFMLQNLKFKANSHVPFGLKRFNLFPTFFL